MADSNAMNGLLGKIYSVMTAPSTIADSAGRTLTPSAVPFISFCSPGIAISDLDFGDLTTKDQVNRCSAFSDLVNSIPYSSSIWQKTDKKSWDIYELALTQVKLAQDELGDDEKAMLKKAEDFLHVEVKTHDPFTEKDTTAVLPSPQLMNYEKMFTAYSAALKAYNNAKITAVSK